MEDHSQVQMQVPITARELEVLAAAANGFSTEETGRELHIGLETVKTHRKHILYKLSARNITHAVAIAFSEGYLGATDT